MQTFDNPGEKSGQTFRMKIGGGGLVAVIVTKFNVSRTQKNRITLQDDPLN